MKFGNLLEWSPVDRALVIGLGILPWPLIGWFVVRHGLEGALFGSMTDLEFSRAVMEPFYAVTLVAIVVVAAWALLVRRRNPASLGPAYAVCQVIGLHTVWIVYFTGTLTSALWVALVSSIAIGLVLFEWAPIFAALLSIGAVLVLTSAAQIAGILPYAPWLTAAPYSNGELHMRPVEALIFYSIIIGLVIMSASMFSFIVIRWRKREQQVTEFSGVLRKMFGRYLSPQVMESLLQNPAALELGGQRRQITVMMTDLRGFTQMAERMEPEPFVQMLNAYYEIMVEVIEKYRGTVNEIIGDALLVIFGAPQAMADRAARACACAIEMQNAMERVNEENRRKGFPDLEMGIGLNDAEVIVGNIGSERRSKYTVIGSGVNLASRIESYTVGGEVLVSQSVVHEAHGILRIDGRREALFKGAQVATTLYEVGGVAGDFGVALSRTADDPAPPPKPLRLRVAALEGKQVGGEGRETEVGAISRKSVRLAAGLLLESHSNVKLNLRGVSPALERLDFYGKVVSGTAGGETSVRFTALPPEVAAYIEGILSR